ncbi:hypothetical protein HN803_04695 [candidate division WWE3 bacterium]|jgi:hypothetical protein|nr:hypothetical protein [Candidatus Scalindua sp.]MBT7350062.1 hypothetical protein [candidate division WWE3 bacterium]
MEDLIKALQIFLKYGNARCPICCVHDILLIDPSIRFEDVSEEDRKELDELDFFFSSEFDCFGSFRFGSA